MNTLLTVEVMLNAGRDLLKLAIEDELNDPDADYAPQDVDDVMERVGDVELVAVVARIVGQIDVAWGNEVGLVFHHMGLVGVQEKSNALYYLIMGCLGHGVGLADDHEKELRKAGGILGFPSPRKFKASPIHCDDAFHELVQGAVKH